MTVAAVLLGLAVGLALGALGGGGGVLAVPGLVLLLGLPAGEATTASLVVVGTTATLATVGHARAGRVSWRTGLTLVLTGLPAAVLGSRLQAGLPDEVLLLAFTAVVVLAAGAMLLFDGHPEQAHLATADPPAGPGPGTTLTRPASPALAPLLAAGAGVGLLTGVLGVGGGFLAVPVLVLLLRVPVAVAVGTSLVVIALNSAAALAARAGTGTLPPWDVVLPFAAAALAAGALGGRLGRRADPHLLTRAFGVLLLVVAAATGVRALL